MRSPGILTELVVVGLGSLLSASALLKVTPALCRMVYWYALSVSAHL